MARVNHLVRAGGLVAAALLAVLGTSSPAWAQVRPAARDSGALVTLLGSDTLALERWVRTGSRVEAEVVLRAPRTSLRRQTLELAPDGTMRRFEERVHDPDNAAGPPLRVEVLEASGGGWARTVTEGDSTRTSRVAGEATALPFVDLVHWPFELVLQRALRGATAQPLLAGGRVIPFRIERTGQGRYSVVHPLRGPTDARVDAAGRLLAMDAARTTRKVVVTRVARVPVREAARRWAAADRAGRPVGELSGRGRDSAAVGAARIVVDYGTPARRGRQIFGAVVPWGQLWRTGANRATHLSTTRPLVLGDPVTGTLELPAGEYTLFSIPAPDGGVLIVNRQTGQNGTAYDAARDLGRVRMRIGKLAEEVERFTIRVAPRGEQAGTLLLEWDRAQFAIPFTVR